MQKKLKKITPVVFSVYKAPRPNREEAFGDN